MTEHRERTKPWYGTARWKRRRLDQLSRDPLCWMCLQAGIVTPATVADHDPPHRGDEVIFWTGNLRSLCKPCHDRDAQARDRSGKRKPRIGLDGWPR